MTRTRRALTALALAPALLGAGAAPALADDAHLGGPAGEIASFPQEERTLTGFWQSEQMPSYRCPASHPYLANRYLTAGVPLGVEVSVSSWLVAFHAYYPIVESPGTASRPTGLYGGSSKVVNWATHPVSYRVTLHCASDARDSYIEDAARQR
jgi:hypothetical protein